MSDSPPVASSVDVARWMSRQARKDTGPELALRRQLHAAGFRYRVGWPVPGQRRRTIDIAFVGRKVAVFVDGCFWHSCPVHATSPRANGAWWSAKLARNVERDRDTDRVLTEAGWTVVRVWEHEQVADAFARVVQQLHAQDQDRGVVHRSARRRRTGVAAT